MRRNFLGIFLLALLSLTVAAPAMATGAADDVAQWNFDVFLNDKKVGKHSFTVSQSGGEKQVESEASFKYTVLFIPAYRYQHTAAERWEDQCLVEIDAKTNANGERLEVRGQHTGSAFRLVNGDDTRAELPECVMTFAYWNPQFLEQSQLLNPQTGEFLEVLVEEVGTDTLEVRGEPVAATRYRLTANEIDLTLWYSPNDEWLGLESVAKGGHIIRYELS
jgi:hypothetical protein